MDNERCDLVCLGFGLSALAFAVAHRERSPKTNILFLETRSKSEWKPLSKLPGQDMNVSFMNDLITTENPRSRYTFIKYLHATGRLVNFTNVGKIAPAGELFEDYLRWVASAFESQVRWNTRAVRLQSVLDVNGAVNEWKIISEGLSTQPSTVISAKRIIIAVGSQPHIAPALRAASPALAHVSNCQQALRNLLSAKPDARIAIVGDGQPAAELLSYLHSVRGNHSATLFTESERLKPCAESSFEHDQVAKPSVDALKRLPPELRSQMHTSGGVPQAHIQLIEQSYERQYAQSVKQPDESMWRFQIKPSTKISKVDRRGVDGGIEIAYANKLTDEMLVDPTVFDLVVSATGYEQQEQQRLLSPLGKLLVNGSVSVDSHYRVNLRKRGVVNGRGLWLVGSLATEQFSGDRLFQILAERARRLVDSLLSIQALESLEQEDADAVQARL